MYTVTSKFFIEKVINAWSINTKNFPLFNKLTTPNILLNQNLETYEWNKLFKKQIPYFKNGMEKAYKHKIRPICIIQTF